MLEERLRDHQNVRVHAYFMEFQANLMEIRTLDLMDQSTDKFNLLVEIKEMLGSH